MSLTQKVAFNSSVIMFGRLAGILVSLITVKILTSKLGPAGYGEFAAILNYIAFFATLADFGFYWILVRELSQGNEDRSKSDYIIGNVIALRSVFATIVLACAVLAVYLVPAGLVPILTAPVKVGVMVVALATFWQSLNMTYVAIFQTHYRMDRPVLADVVGRIVSLAVLIPFVVWHLNVAWLVSAMVFGSMATFAINLYFAQRYSTFSLRFNFGYWSKLMRQSAVLGVVSVLALIYFKVDGVLLSILKTSTEVGIYSAPYKIIEIVNFFPAAFMGIVFVALANRWRDNKAGAANLVNRAIEVMIVLSLPVLVGGFILAGPIMRFVSSEAYANTHTFTAILFGYSIPISGIVVLKMLLVAVGIDFFANIFGKAIIAFGSQQLLLWPNVVAVVLNIGLNLYLIPRWSYAGAALVTIATEAMVLMVQVILMRRFVQLCIPWLMIGRTILAVLGMALVLLWLGEVNVLISLPVGAGTYLALATLTGAISKETLRLVTHRNK